MDGGTKEVGWKEHLKERGDRKRGVREKIKEWGERKRKDEIKRE